MNPNNYLPQGDQHGPAFSDLMMLETPVTSANKMAGGAVYLNCGEDNMQMGDGGPPPPMGGYQMEADAACNAMMHQQHQMMHQQQQPIMPPQENMFSQPLEGPWGNPPHMQMEHPSAHSYYNGGRVMDPAQVGYPAPAAMMGPDAGVPLPPWHPDDIECEEVYAQDILGAENEEHMQQEAWERRRRERRRELNRAAATRCRERKLERIRTLQLRAETLRADTERLTRTVQAMRAQVLSRRERIRVHASAGCLVSLPPAALPVPPRSASPRPDGADGNHHFINKL